MGAWQVFMEALLGISQLSPTPATLTVELLAMVVEHPASNRYSRTRAAHLLAGMEASLPQMDFAAAVERGQALTPQAAIELVEPLSIVGKPRLKLNQPLDNPLTERELEILCLLADGFSTKEVSQQLFLSVGTVRWYLNQIYSKLSVHSRIQAIARARELKLLG